MFEDVSRNEKYKLYLFTVIDCCSQNACQRSISKDVSFIDAAMVVYLPNADQNGLILYL